MSRQRGFFRTADLCVRRGSRLKGTPLADGGVALEARVLCDGGDVRDAEGVHDEFALKQHFVVEHRVGCVGVRGRRERALQQFRGANRRSRCILLRRQRHSADAAPGGLGRKVQPWNSTHEPADRWRCEGIARWEENRRGDGSGIQNVAATGQHGEALRTVGPGRAEQFLWWGDICM